MSAVQIAPELACVPSAIPAAERQAHFALASELFQQRATQKAVLSNGYAVRFQADALEAVARFVTNERKCCPFMTFEVVVPPDSDSFLLRMTGPDGTREMLDAELNLAPKSSCGCG